MHLFTFSREVSTLLIRTLNKMNIKYFLIICVVFVDVHCDCGDYFSCLRGLVHSFFGTYNKTTINDNNTDLHEVKTYDNSDFDVILKDLSKLVNDEVAGGASKIKSKTARFNNNKTNVLIKVFDFDHPKGFDTNFTTETPEVTTIMPTTEYIAPKGTALNIDAIKQVNNMIDSLENFEQNLIQSDGEMYEDLDGKNGTDYPNIDYIELYKDATVEYVDFVPTELPKVSEDISKTEEVIENDIEYSLNIEDQAANSLDNDVKVKCQGSISEAVYPWIVAIFVKNNSKDNQFEYYCDGALLSDRFILTAARCVHLPKGAVNPGSLLLVPGKRSLQSIDDNEKAYRVFRITTHSNFTVKDGLAKNDLALLETEDLVNFNDGVKPACLVDSNSSSGQVEATTGWKFTGELSPIYFKKQTNCEAEVENTFCGTYGFNIATCPSYGGLHVAKYANAWYLDGIRAGDPEAKGICIDRDVSYTDLEMYTDWIENIIES